MNLEYPQVYALPSHTFPQDIHSFIHNCSHLQTKTKDCRLVVGVLCHAFCTMHFAYIDESGDPGANGSVTYALACVLVDTDTWATTFDSLIAYRRFLRAQFRIPVRLELKANHLLRNAGGLRPLGLSEAARRDIYRQTMRLQESWGFRPSPW